MIGVCTHLNKIDKDTEIWQIIGVLPMLKELSAVSLLGSSKSVG